MTRPRVLDLSPARIADELRKIKSDIRELRAAKSSQATTIGSGGMLVNGGTVRVRVPGDLLLEDENGAPIWRASTDPLRTDGRYDRNNGLSLATGWTQYGETSALTSPVPDGFSRGNFMLMVSAGDSFSPGEGNISVQPTVRFIWGDGSTPSTFFGDAVNSGNNSVSVATFFWSADFAVNIPGTRLAFGLQAARVGTELSGTSGNWHVGTQVIYQRAA